MKKTFTVLMGVLFAALLIVSCNDETESGYKIGSTGPAGGIIFYINPNAESDGWTYLEAAKSDLAGKYVWGSNGVYSTGKEIGDGKDNTRKLIEAKDANTSLSFPAAEAVWGKTIDGYSDWFLPSKEELHLMYVNLKKGGFDDFTNTTYWSSTGVEGGSNNYAEFKNFTSDEKRSATRDSECYIRPVRSF